MTQTSQTLLSTDIDTNTYARSAYIKANDRTWHKCPILKTKREMDVKKERRESPKVQHTQNVQLEVKQTTQQNNVEKAQVRIYVPRGTDHEKKTEETEQTTKNVLSPRSLIQKKNFATTPNARTHVRKTIYRY